VTRAHVRSESDTGGAAAASGKPSPAWDDHQLVNACLKGNQDAWAALLRKYKDLIYSVPVRYGFSAEDAADVFQTVSMELYTRLSRLREVDALRGWLLRVAAHECFHRKQDRQKYRLEDLEDAHPEVGPKLQDQPAWLDELERQQVVREAMASLTPRCREMIRMLFFEEPAKPYNEVAESLGLATGSIGFIRARCLKQMARALEELGW
jgi:RNA polymerase sigma factor (sigma-70 family)